MRPFAELHVHLEGTFEVEQFVDIARRNGVTPPSWDVDELRSRYAFDDLQSFLDLYYENLGALRTEEDFHDLAAAYLKRAALAGVRHTEMFFDPQTHLGNGIPLEVVFAGFGAAVDEARRDLGLSADLILCFLRDLGGDAAVETLRAAMPFRDRFVGVGLDSTEVGYPPALYAEAFGIARSEGLRRVAHAGEEGGPENVRDALDLLHVERIDHGNRALEDPDLVARLRDERIPLTVCPLSNLALKTAPPDLADHPLRRMLDEGLLVTLNSDDPAYFGGYHDDNVRAVTEALALTDSELDLLARNSFEASFLGETDRARFLAEIPGVPGPLEAG
ncbi:Adenine deaminase [Frondihabitans sp. 762G35]|uniref:adenosine deaminase n=1 Tax=Frondihabitans sp. 762G35 TaxID=1446794 RepID=UPI000D20C886|nr:adenosine deaminase [Frondihabitans sp. 762G35]ARC56791.1 Adenine deaminase [Frondihabitans sp. 762G35]